MGNLTGTLILFILIIVLASCVRVLKKEYEFGQLVPKSTFGKKGNSLGEFGETSSSSPLFSPGPVGLAIKKNYLFVCDASNNRIQTLKINPDGSLSFKSTFGKEGSGLGEFRESVGLAIKDDYLFVTDKGNSWIQVLEIKY